MKLLKEGAKHKERELRESSLKELLTKLPSVVQTGIPHIEIYSFGAVYHPRLRIWHIYNLQTNNCIATIKFRDNKAVIQYRANSWYADVLKNFSYDGRATVCIPSIYLRRRSRWVRDNLRRRVQQSKASFGREPQERQPRILPRRDSRGRFTRAADVFEGWEWPSEQSVLPQAVTDYEGVLRRGSEYYAPGVGIYNIETNAWRGVSVREEQEIAQQQVPQGYSIYRSTTPRMTRSV